MSALVLGIGNLLIGDEGVGCRAVAELSRRYTLPPAVECIDGGTAGFELLSLLDGRDQVILIDACKMIVPLVRSSKWKTNMYPKPFLPEQHRISWAFAMCWPRLNSRNRYLKSSSYSVLNPSA